MTNALEGGPCISHILWLQHFNTVGSQQGHPASKIPHIGNPQMLPIVRIHAMITMEKQAGQRKAESLSEFRCQWIIS